MLLGTSLRILCFGDSLTAGYSRSLEPVRHPYANSLKSSLDSSFGNPNISIDVDGYLGDWTECLPNKCFTGVPGFLPRITNLYDDSQSANPYDYAIILGGTNDVNHSRPVSDMFTSLKKVWSVPLKHKAKVLAMTVPECSDCGDETSAATKKLNKMILSHKATNFYTFDLYNSVQYSNMTADERKLYWDDGIHFTPAGYDLVGNHIAKRMSELILASNSSSQAPMSIRSARSLDLALVLFGLIWIFQYSGFGLSLLY